MFGKKQNLSEQNSNILVLAGPTSTGKTSLALKLAQRNNAVIISADSRQIYKNMDVGTGKVPISFNGSYVKNTVFTVMDGVQIFGYDLIDPSQEFSVVDYLNYAIPAIDNQLKLGNRVIIAGGTGFYVNALLDPSKINSNPVDLILREELAALTESDRLEKLSSLAPAVYKKIDKKNKYRVLRALEKTLSTKAKNKSLFYETHPMFTKVLLTASREFLYTRVDAWVDAVWNNGLIDETRTLIESYPHNAKLNGLIYKTCVSYIRRDITQEAATQRCKWDLHAYIRRQQTWFKKYFKSNVINIADLAQEQCIIEIEKLWINKL